MNKLYFAMNRHSVVAIYNNKRCDTDYLSEIKIKLEIARNQLFFYRNLAIFVSASGLHLFYQIDARDLAFSTGLMRVS